MVIKKDSLKSHVKVKNSMREKVWKYMRRNRTFRFGDVISITEISFKYLKEMLHRLETAGYIKTIKIEKPYTSSMFTLIKNTGIHAPTINNVELYDFNTKETIDTRPLSSISKILNSMKQEKMTPSQVVKSTNLGIATVKKVLKLLRDKEIVTALKPIERINDQIAFLVDLSKIEELKDDIKSGKFITKGALV